jgi:hypothetical protein
MLGHSVTNCDKNFSLFIFTSPCSLHLWFTTLYCHCFFILKLPLALQGSQVFFSYSSLASVYLTGRLLYFFQHCFTCRPSDSTVPEEAGIEPRIEPRIVATLALAVRRSILSARFHPLLSYICCC